MSFIRLSWIFFDMELQYIKLYLILMSFKLLFIVLTNFDGFYLSSIIINTDKIIMYSF